MNPSLPHLWPWIAWIRCALFCSLGIYLAAWVDPLGWKLVGGIAGLYSLGILIPPIRRRFDLTGETVICLDGLFGALIVYATGGVESDLLLLLYLPILEAAVNFSLLGTVGAAIWALICINLLGAIQGFDHPFPTTVYQGIVTFAVSIVCFAGSFLLLRRGYQQMAARIRILESEQELLMELIDRDPLTRVLNAPAFQRRFEAELSHSISASKPLSFVILQIDWLQRFGERKGQEGIDEAMIRIAQMIARSLRLHDVVGRMEADRFGVLLPDVAENTARSWMKRIRAQHDITLPAIGMGWAGYPKCGADVQSVIESAENDLALEPFDHI